MTQRDRQAPSGGALQVTPGQPERAAGPDASASGGSLWERWYAHASPAQRQDLLGVAFRQGVLYPSQLGEVPANGSTARPAIASFLNGPIADLDLSSLPAIEPEDSALDAIQRDAVARAVGTPDICLIQGLPGTGKSRVVAEIVRQAVGRNQRVLLFAATAAGLDRVLERLGGRDDLLALRLLSPGEAPEALAPCVRRLSIPERLKALQEQTIPAARAAATASCTLYERCHSQSPAWAQLVQLAQRWQELESRRTNLDGQRHGLAQAIAQQRDAAATAAAPTPFQAQVRAWSQKREATLAEVDRQAADLHIRLDQARTESQRCNEEREALKPLVEALDGWRLWTGAWWRGRFRGGLRARFAEAQRGSEEHAAACHKLEQDTADLQAQRAATEASLSDEISKLCDAESQRRLADLDAELQEIARQRHQLEQQSDHACAAIEPELRPATLSVESVGAVQAQWEQRLARLDREAALAAQWAEAVKQAAAIFPEQLAACANVVATTAVRGALSGSLFDLLIVDEAHRLTEPDLNEAALHARRWVLVGEPVPTADTVARPGGLRSTYFQRLWQRFHPDPCRLPTAWSRRGDRLVCSLRPITPDQERRLEAEPVADRPDIELRILVPPRSPRPAAAAAPEIVEVTFPVQMPVAQAQEFLYRELEEAAIEARGAAPRWEETEKLVLWLGPRSLTGTEVVPLETGLAARLERDGWHTAALEFDPAAGWSRPTALRWVADHLGLHDTGRTALLDRGHRWQGMLAALISDLLFGGALVAPAADEASCEPVIDFVSVPSYSDARRRAESGGPDRSGRRDSGAAISVLAPRLKTVKGGAGLEMDLAEARPIEHLPADLRAALPRKGLVNFLEARAVVAHLEALLADPAFVEAGLRWQEGPASPCRQTGTGCSPPQAGKRPHHCPTVAVMALYPAQVELLRLLMACSPAALASPLTIEIDHPSAFRQRECLVALVSLTRSHSHRAVAYSDGPGGLAEALTRPTTRLVLVGDPATLARRSQWQGPLEHLDDEAARTERRVVGQLVAYLQGQGPYSAAFRLVESGGA